MNPLNFSKNIESSGKESSFPEVPCQKKSLSSRFSARNQVRKVRAIKDLFRSWTSCNFIFLCLKFMKVEKRPITQLVEWLPYKQ
jgi:hypothetical protein